MERINGKATEIAISPAESFEMRSQRNANLKAQQTIGVLAQKLKAVIRHSEEIGADRALGLAKAGLLDLCESRGAAAAR